MSSGSYSQDSRLAFLMSSLADFNKSSLSHTSLATGSKLFCSYTVVKTWVSVYSCACLLPSHSIRVVCCLVFCCWTGNLIILVDCLLTNLVLSLVWVSLAMRRPKDVIANDGYLGVKKLSKVPSLPLLKLSG